MRTTTLEATGPNNLNPFPALPPRLRLWMVEFFGAAGLFHYAWPLANALVAAGDLRGAVDVTLLCGPEPEVQASERTASAVHLRPTLLTWHPRRNVSRIPAWMRRPVRALRYAVAWMQIVWLAWRERPDLLLFGDFEHRIDAWGVAVLRALGLPVADVWHNVQAFERWHGRNSLKTGQVAAESDLLRDLHWRDRLARRCHPVFVHSAGLARDLDRRAGVHAAVIPHGTQDWLARQAGPDPGLRQRLRLPPGRLVALLFGTLTRYKGVEILLAALTQLPAAERPLTVVAGYPADFDLAFWRAWADAQGLTADLRWVGEYVPNHEVAWYFRLADLVVLPYRAASQSGVAHMALALDKPLLVTRTGALGELLDETGAGWVVPPEDPSALAQRLSAVVRQPSLLQTPCRRARAAAADRSWSRVAEQVLMHLQAERRRPT